MRYTFTIGGIPIGGEEHVSNEYMISVIEAYIYQEKGVRVEIGNDTAKFINNSREKGLLLKAYAWANDHLK